MTTLELSKIDRYRALLSAARSIFSLVKIDDLIETVLSQAPALMRCERFSLFLPDAATEELVLHSAQGAADVFHAHRIPWNAGVAGTAFHKREFIRSDDAVNDPRIFRPQNEALRAAFVTKALLCAPLVYGEACLGVVQALNPIGNTPFSDEDEELFLGFTNVITGALLRIDRESRYREQVKFDHELQLAQEIQQSQLPPGEIILPFAEIRTRYRPARTVGGDFYNVFKLERNRVLVVLGDVSGKGIPAALTVAMLAGEMSGSILRLNEGRGLSDFVESLNKSICPRLSAGRFVAATFLLYDPSAGSMEIVCAGQFSPWHCPNETWSQIQCARDLPLGVDRNQSFQTTTLCAFPGEKWVLISDGINEGRNDKNEEFGIERLVSTLNAGSACAVEMLQRTWDIWSDFVGNKPLHDDACLLLFLTKPTPELQITSSPGQCKQARFYIEHWASAAGFSDLERGGIVLAADEAVTNIMRHTYQNATDKPIILTGKLDDTHLHLYLRDYGPPVDPATLKGRALDDIKPGGLGLHFLKTIFPVVEHEVLADGNQWHLAKPFVRRSPL